MKIISIWHIITGNHNLTFEEKNKLAGLNSKVFFAGGAYNDNTGTHLIPELTEKDKQETQRIRDSILICSCGVKKYNPDNF